MGDRQILHKLIESQVAPKVAAGFCLSYSAAVGLWPPPATDSHFVNFCPVFLWVLVTARGHYLFAFTSNHPQLQMGTSPNSLHNWSVVSDLRAVTQSQFKSLSV